MVPACVFFSDGLVTCLDSLPAGPSHGFRGGFGGRCLSGAVHTCQFSLLARVTPLCGRVLSIPWATLCTTAAARRAGAPALHPYLRLSVHGSCLGGPSRGVRGTFRGAGGRVDPWLPAAQERGRVGRLPTATHNVIATGSQAPAAECTLSCGEWMVHAHLPVSPPSPAPRGLPAAAPVGCSCAASWLMHPSNPENTFITSCHIFKWCPSWCPWQGMQGAVAD